MCCLKHINSRPPIFSDNPPTVYPDPNLPDNKLVPGDIWYDTSDDAVVLSSTCGMAMSGLKMLVMVSRLLATLPLAVQPTDVAEDPDVVARLRTREERERTLMQSDLNNETFYSLFNQRRKTNAW